MNDKMDDKLTLYIIQSIVVMFLIYVFAPVLVSIAYVFPILLIPIGLYLFIRSIGNSMAKTHAKTLNKKEK